MYCIFLCVCLSLCLSNFSIFHCVIFSLPLSLSLTLSPTLALGSSPHKWLLTASSHRGEEDERNAQNGTCLCLLHCYIPFFLEYQSAVPHAGSRGLCYCYVRNLLSKQYSEALLNVRWKGRTVVEPQGTGMTTAIHSYFIIGIKRRVWCKSAMLAPRGDNK